MSADGTAAAPATPAQTAAPPMGGSILTTGLPEAPVAQPGSAEAEVQAVIDGPPEWAVPKYWNAEKYKADPQNYLKEYAQTVSGSYRHAESLLGGERVPVPKDDRDEDGWNRWYAASGRPEAPDKYEFKRPAELPAGIDYNEDLEKTYRQWAHANGLNKKQAASFYDGFVKHEIDRHVAFQQMRLQERTRIEADLMREHGPQYEGFVGNAKSVIAKYGDADFLKWLDESGQGNDPRMIRVLGRIGKDLGGTTKLKGSLPPEVAPADLDKAIAEHTAKNQDALFDKAHPQHDAAVRERRRLFEMRFPEQAQS